MTESLMQKLKQCRLSGICINFDRIKEEATEKGWTFEDFLETLLDAEILSRENRRFQKLLNRAKFPILKTIEQFDFGKAPYIKKKDIMDMYGCEFIDQKMNIIFLGAPGTGKSHISTAIGIEACKQGKTVAFFTAANLGNKMVEMQETKQLSRFIDKIRNVDLLIIDELGYVKLSNQTTQLMFQIFSERYERGSILINTNLEFADWGSIFNDERMTAAILDRLIHNSKILTFNGESYRYRMQKVNQQLQAANN